jgi:DNA topoisomerase-1
LDSYGIGKPSTFANLVHIIQDRKYVIKKDVVGKQIEKMYYEMDKTLLERNEIFDFGHEKNKLQITHVGIIVIEFLIKQFPDLFDYEYSRHVEENLLNIDCNDYVSRIDTSISSIEGKEEIVIDEDNKIIVGRNGTVIINKTDECTKFVKLNQDTDLLKIRNGEYSLDEISINGHYKGNYLGEELYIKNGKYGIYTTWKGKNVSLQYFKKVPIEKITLENIIWCLSEKHLL